MQDPEEGSTIKPTVCLAVCSCMCDLCNTRLSRLCLLPPGVLLAARCQCTMLQGIPHSSGVALQAHNRYQSCPACFSSLLTLAANQAACQSQHVALGVGNNSRSFKLDRKAFHIMQHPSSQLCCVCNLSSATPAATAQVAQHAQDSAVDKQTCSLTGHAHVLFLTEQHFF